MTNLYYDVPTVICTDGQGVMDTSSAKEYQVIEAEILGHSTTGICTIEIDGQKLNTRSPLEVQRRYSLDISGCRARYHHRVALTMCPIDEEPMRTWDRTPATKSREQGMCRPVGCEPCQRAWWDRGLRGAGRIVEKKFEPSLPAGPRRRWLLRGARLDTVRLESHERRRLAFEAIRTGGLSVRSGPHSSSDGMEHRRTNEVRETFFVMASLEQASFADCCVRRRDNGPGGLKRSTFARDTFRRAL